MLARLRKQLSDKEQGFTLIELLVVIIIIGILASIAIPVFLNQRKKGWDSQAQSDARNIATAEETYFSDNNAYLTQTALTTAPIAISNLSYKASSTVAGVVIVGVNSAGSALDSTAVNGFCAAVSSKSGNVYTYNSSTGTLSKGTASTCPTS